MSFRLSGWLMAVVVSLGVHVLALVWVTNENAPEAPIPPGGGSVVLQLADGAGAVPDGPAEPEPEPLPEPEPEPPSEPRPELPPESEPEPLPEPEPPSEPEPEAPSEPEPRPEPVPSAASSGGEAGGTASAPSETPSDEDGDPQAVLDYRQELLLWLQRHKQYPRRLRRRGVEGEVLVAFTLDADGRLLEQEIVRGSGEPALDAAASELLRRAEPMPPIPRSMGVTSYRAQVPIRYAIR